MQAFKGRISGQPLHFSHTAAGMSGYEIRNQKTVLPGLAYYGVELPAESLEKAE